MTVLRSLAFAAGAAIALACAPAFAFAQGSVPVVWKLPSAYPADNFHTENLSLFAKDVAAQTDGKLTITTYPGASLFPAPAIKSAVRIGQVQAGEVLISLHDNEDAIYGVDVIPFLATSYADARKLWAASRPAIEQKFAAQGLMTLFAVPWPPQGIFAKREINQIADMKGLSFRTYNAATQRLAEIIGAYPVNIQAADLPRALATGLINAFITSSATGYDSKVWESMGYYYDAQAWIPKNVTFVNRAAFDALDAETRAALLTAAAAAETRGWAMSQAKAAWYLEQLTANGMKVLTPSQPLNTGLRRLGDQLTAEWLGRAGGTGRAVINGYKGM
jgi:TRAP-type C4-dicarboxylate transport system substrate-binding protein